MKKMKKSGWLVFRRAKVKNQQNPSCLAARLPAWFKTPINQNCGSAPSLSQDQVPCLIPCYLILSSKLVSQLCQPAPFAAILVSLGFLFFLSSQQTWIMKSVTNQVRRRKNEMKIIEKICNQITQSAKRLDSTRLDPTHLAQVKSICSSVPEWWNQWFFLSFLFAFFFRKNWCAAVHQLDWLL